MWLRINLQELVVNIDGEVVNGRCLPWQEEQLSHVQIKFKVVFPHPLRDVYQTCRDSCCVVLDGGKDRISCVSST